LAEIKNYFFIGVTHQLYTTPMLVGGSTPPGKIIGRGVGFSPLRLLVCWPDPAAVFSIKPWLKIDHRDHDCDQKPDPDQPDPDLKIFSRP
jgi:hypothetical protein